MSKQAITLETLSELHYSLLSDDALEEDVTHRLSDKDADRVDHHLEEMAALLWDARVDDKVHAAVRGHVIRALHYATRARGKGGAA